MVSKNEHILKDLYLSVSLLLPKPPPEIITGPTEPNLLLLYGASSKAGSEAIKEFVTPHAQSSLVRIEFGVTPGKVLLTFQEEPSEQILSLY